MQRVSNRWALVLAAGSGTRLSGLTADGAGGSVPKQFCSLLGGASLLDETLERAASVAPAAQTAVVVAANHRPFWRSALDGAADSNVIVQPRNRGTANGILLGLSSILARDPDAVVAILPSDHYVANEAVMARALTRAVDAVEAARNRTPIVFLGIAPDAADSELGYIVPGGRSAGGARRIARFVEKPSRAAAEQLVRERALWNSFLLVARASALVELIERRFPAEVAAFRNAFREPPGERARRELESLYESLPEIDFSRHVVEGADARLEVIAVPPCGWSDLGTPERVAGVLARRSEAAPARSRQNVPPYAGRAAGSIPFNLAEAHARLMGELARGSAAL